MNYALSAVLIRVLSKMEQVLDLAIKELEERRMEKDTGDSAR